MSTGVARVVIPKGAGSVPCAPCSSSRVSDTASVSGFVAFVAAPDARGVGLGDAAFWGAALWAPVRDPAGVVADFLAADVLEAGAFAAPFFAAPAFAAPVFAAPVFAAPVFAAPVFAAPPAPPVSAAGDVVREVFLAAGSLGVALAAGVAPPRDSGASGPVASGVNPASASVDVGIPADVVALETALEAGLGLAGVRGVFGPDRGVRGARGVEARCVGVRGAEARWAAGGAAAASVPPAPDAACCVTASES
ncbi:MAG: hypothetical protein RI885_2698 [Actinomycetota bacterium]